MICKNCGKELADDSRFCSYCGVAQVAHEHHNETGTDGQTDETPKRKLLTRKQAIFWGLYILYSIGWLLSFYCGSFKTDSEVGTAILFWVLPLLFVIAKRSMKSFIKK